MNIQDISTNQWFLLDESKGITNEKGFCSVTDVN